MKLLDLNKVAEETDEETSASPMQTPPTHNVHTVSTARNLDNVKILESPTSSSSILVKETPSSSKIPPQSPSLKLFGQQLLLATTPPPSTTSRQSASFQDLAPPKKRKILTPPLSTYQEIPTRDSVLQSSTKSMMGDQNITKSQGNTTMSPSGSGIILNSPFSSKAVPDSSLDKNLGLADPKTGKNRLIKPIYKWACNERCKVQPLKFLKSNDIQKVSLHVKCMVCRKKCNMWLNVDVELKKILSLLSKHKDEVPVTYVAEKAKRCPMCKVVTIMEPVQANEKRNTNWMGLLLGHELNSLNFDRLVYFCRQRGLKWSDNCSKARILHLCMSDLVDQLEVNSPQD